MVSGGSVHDDQTVQRSFPAAAEATAGWDIDMGSAIRLAKMATIAGATRPASIAGAMRTVAPSFCAAHSRPFGNPRASHDKFVVRRASPCTSSRTVSQDARLTAHT